MFGGREARFRLWSKSRCNCPEGAKGGEIPEAEEQEELLVEALLVALVGGCSMGDASGELAAVALALARTACLARME